MGRRGALTTRVALLRGINVGGRNTLPMKRLVEILEDLGGEDVRTYIQSGNAVFRHRSKADGTQAKKIAKAIAAEFGFEPGVLLLDAKDLERATAGNPFPEGEAEPKSLHYFFLAEPPVTPDLDMLEGLRSEGERFHLARGVFYLHAPSGIGRSKLAARVERALGVATTARNARTVGKLLELAGG